MIILLRSAMLIVRLLISTFGEKEKINQKT